MKIDKDFAVRCGGKLFTAPMYKITEINIDGCEFSMTCIYDNGTEFNVTAHTKDVEFFNTAQIPPLAQGGVVTGRDQSHVYYGYSKVGDEPKSDIEIVTPLEQIIQSLYETMGINEPDSNTATEISRKEAEKMHRFDCCGEYAEQLAKSKKKGNTNGYNHFTGGGSFELAMKQMAEKNRFSEISKHAYVCNGKSKNYDNATVNAMKDAADAIGKAAEAIRKATEQIKVELSIDGEKFSKLIKDYGKPMARSGR